MTKFRDLLHAKAFIDRGLELHIITEDQVDQVMECELNETASTIATKPSTVCVWVWSGIAGDFLRSLDHHDPLWDVEDAESPTTPLPIVKPCHRCGESHDEKYPPRCADMLEKDQRIADLEAERERLKSKVIELEEWWDELREAATDPESDIDAVWEVVNRKEL